MSIVRIARDENISIEQQIKFMQDRISLTEDNFANLCSSFGEYVKKLSKVRDKTDNIALVIHDFSNAENICKSMKTQLEECSNLLAKIGDYRDIQVKNLEANVVKELCLYNTLCQNAKTEVKRIFGAKEKEMNKQHHLKKIKERSPHNNSQINKAEIELFQATVEVSRMQKALEEHIDIFERKKLLDVKSILKQYMIEELAYHSKAIQLYTDAYKCIDNIDQLEDVENFREYLHTNKIEKRLRTVRNMYDKKVCIQGNTLEKSDQSPTHNQDINQSVISTVITEEEEESSESDSESVQETMITK